MKMVLNYHKLIPSFFWIFFMMSNCSQNLKKKLSSVNHIREAGQKVKKYDHCLWLLTFKICRQKKSEKWMLICRINRAFSKLSSITYICGHEDDTLQFQALMEMALWFLEIFNNITVVIGNKREILQV